LPEIRCERKAADEDSRHPARQNRDLRTREGEKGAARYPPTYDHAESKVGRRQIYGSNHEKTWSAAGAATPRDGKVSAAGVNW